MKKSICCFVTLLYLACINGYGQTLFYPGAAGKSAAEKSILYPKNTPGR
ncbi:MAG: hypothetical protein LWX56_06530 [Ignavibacteria bacterium]|nr:hypothetical protein [Ignavibacteria bacterium]